GAIMVDTTIRPTGQGHPFGYMDQATIGQSDDEDILRLVREYDPTWEFVTALFKHQDRMSSYRIGVLSAKPREDLGNRVDPDRGGR
ncbi:MAG: hypothetical protein L0Y56_17100, partial [Nitrospira sp.]|nr:hypothetical protein [Nitrospira sp.]